MSIATDALLSDTSNMTAEQFGAYMRILLVMWRHGGRLPYIDNELALIAGVSLRKWQRIKTAVCRPLHVENGHVSQKRLMETYIHALKIRSTRKWAADARWLKVKGNR